VCACLHRADLRQKIAPPALMVTADLGTKHLAAPPVPAPVAVASLDDEIDLAMIVRSTSPMLASRASRCPSSGSVGIGSSSRVRCLPDVAVGALVLDGSRYSNSERRSPSSSASSGSCRGSRRRADADAHRHDGLQNR
jgi:hypothetical protein